MISSKNAVDQYENVNLDEELAQQAENNESDAAEYQRLLEVARKGIASGQTPDTILAMINATVDPLNEFDDAVEDIVRYVLGPPSAWSSGSTEAREFRKMLRESFQVEWNEFSQGHPDLSVGEAMRKLPATYYAAPLLPAQLDALVKSHPSTMQPSVGAFRARIHYHDTSGNSCSVMREIQFLQSAGSAIQEVVARIHVVLNVSGVKTTEYMFKVLGRADYLYGDESMINFQYIRDCIVKKEEVALYIMRMPMSSACLTAARFAPKYAVMRRQTPNHEGISARNFGAAIFEANEFAPKEISLWDVPDDLSVRIEEIGNLTLSAERNKVENLRDADDVFVCAVVEVVFGGVPIVEAQRTPWRCCKSMVGSSTFHRVLWGPSGLLHFNVKLNCLPREARLCITIVGVSGDNFATVSEYTAEQLMDDEMKREKEVITKFVNLLSLNIFESREDKQICPIFYLAFVNVQVFDHLGVLRTGLQEARMWSTDQKANPIGVSSSNPDPSAIGIRMTFPSFALRVIHPSGPPPEYMVREMEISLHDALLRMDMQLRENKIAQLRMLKKILATDPLYSLAPTDRILLWQYRNDLIKRPRALCKFLLAVDWTKPAAVREAHELLDQWAPLQPMDALELLDARYADTRVREYAIECLDKMPNNLLANCVLQLVQVLKYEPYHYSALARFLLNRSLLCPHRIGHMVFWHLKAEMHNPAVSERHGLIIEEYLTRTTSRREILRQQYVVMMLLTAALKVKESKKTERRGDLCKSLDSLKLPPTFSLALNPRMECSGLVVEKCKVMDSKKLPLWLLFRNADPLGTPIYVMFKAGDDLRQDLLTLQMFELMDSVWKGAGMDLHMIPYGCVATGEGVGMIEIVLSSQTVANITRQHGGPQAAFSEEPLMNWLRKFNRTPSDVERCLWNFVYSTAGSCVATYILGIGDRHNDNIMLRENGTLFHIDFGHFLGNFKTKFGFKRETAPFILTPMMAFMMGGQSSPIYQHFVEVACRAYNVIRRQSNLLITLFMLMLSTGIPELQRKEDIMWLQSVLLTDASDEVASKHIRAQIVEALENKRTLINDYIHIVAH